jgi:hypothetical protein
VVGGCVVIFRVQVGMRSFVGSKNQLLDYVGKLLRWVKYLWKVSFRSSCFSHLICVNCRQFAGRGRDTTRYVRSRFPLAIGFNSASLQGQQLPGEGCESIIPLTAAISQPFACSRRASFSDCIRLKKEHKFLLGAISWQCVCSCGV